VKLQPKKEYDQNNLGQNNSDDLSPIVEIVGG
jgi:hypothetical protein